MNYKSFVVPDGRSRSIRPRFNDNGRLSGLIATLHSIDAPQEKSAE